MPVEIAALAPHPPIIIPEIGGREREKVQKTIGSMEELGQAFGAGNLETIITISPHGPVFSEVISSLDVDPLRGSFANFGYPEIEMQARLDGQLSREIEQSLARENIPFRRLEKEDCRRYRISPELDHGVLVPLYFLQEQELDIDLIPINIGLLPYGQLMEAGQVLQQVLADSSRRIGIIASGDLSHRLIPSAPAGYNPRGQEFDEQVMQIIEEGQLEKLKDLDKDLINKAGECALRPLLILAGILSEQDFSSAVLSYEGPFGVGYGVALFAPGSVSPPDLAREAVQNYLEKGEIMETPPQLPEFLEKKAGAFVSIKDRKGNLRGCIGTLEPTQKTLAGEIIRNAVQSAFQDPRFTPIKNEEMADLVFSVDIIHPPEPVSSLDQLDPAKYGVIVKQGAQKGVLLPDLPGIDSAEEQVAIARQKAGLGETPDLEIYRFRVERFMQE